MRSMLANKTIIPAGQKSVFYGYASLVVLFCAIALITESYIIALAPVTLLTLVAIINDYRVLYYGFWVVVPFSIEFHLGSFGTDMPTEPIMLGLTGLAILLFISSLSRISLLSQKHTISVLLLLHLIWMLFTAIYSQSSVISAKFFIAKIWYVIPFFYLSFYMIKGKAEIGQIFKILSIFLTVAIAIVLTRHAMDGFTFAGSHHVVRPIFRNHVSYSAILVVVIPFIWALYQNTTKGAFKKYLLVALALFVIGTYFSYTRAAQLCIVIAIGSFFIFKYRLGKLAILSSCILILLLGAYLGTNNRYLDFAPDFEKTIVHRKFDNLLEATLKMEDISTMERVYRWVAGTQMIGERPIVGFGPGSFYSHYTKYTVRSFETYVSDNPEKSGMHNYYLMMWVEQGIIGFLIFVALVFAMILCGERAYHRVTDPQARRYVMAATISTVIICALSLMNDIIETDKVGPFFFLNAAIIVIYDLRSRDSENVPQAY